MMFISKKRLAVIAVIGMASITPVRGFAQVAGSTTVGQDPQSFNSVTNTISSSPAAGTYVQGTRGVGVMPGVSTPTTAGANTAYGTALQPVPASVLNKIPIQNPGVGMPQYGNPNAQTNVNRLPNDGDVNASGQVVHYKVVGHIPGTGYGALEGVPLPQRSFSEDQ